MKVEAAIAFHIANGDTTYLEVETRFQTNQLALGYESLHEASADDACSEEPDTNCGVHPAGA